MMRGKQIFVGAVLFLLGGLLAWLTVSRSLVAFLVTVAPNSASAISPSAPVVQRRIADMELTRLRALAVPTENPADSTAASAALSNSAAQQPVDIAAGLELVERRAVKSLELAPLSAEALRIIGVVRQLEGDETRAAVLFKTAYSLSRHDPLAIWYAMTSNLKSANYDRAIAEGDLLLRSHPELISFVGPTFIALAQSGKSDDLVAIMAKKPPWRRILFRQAVGYTDMNPATPLVLLRKLAAAGSPPTHEEVSTYVWWLVDAQRFDLAYSAWLSLLSTEQLATIGYVNNGDFSKPVSGLPYDWIIENGMGSLVEILAHDDERTNRGLKIDFHGGRVDFGKVQQWLVLPPGAYRLTGSFRGEIVAARGLVWKIVCFGEVQRTIAESKMFTGIQRQWQEFEVTVDVPETGCAGQLLQLIHSTRTTSEKFATGGGWFDNIAIRRR